MKKISLSVIAFALFASSLSFVASSSVAQMANKAQGMTKQGADISDSMTKPYSAKF